MLLSTSTLGCPQWPLATVVARAEEYGYDAIDFRGLAGQMEIYKLPEFTTDAARTKEMLAKAGIEISGFSTSITLVAGGNRTAEGNLTELHAYCHLCEQFGVTAIRVFEGGADLTADASVAPAAASMREMAKMASDHGAQVLLETHAPHLGAEHCRRIMEEADMPGAGILWDLFNPWSGIGEEPETTWKALGRWIHNTHWKDAAPDASKREGHQYCLFGEGDFPVAKFLEVLRAGDYTGPFTLEWEKQWHPDIAEPELAFPAFVKKMRAL